MKRSLKILAPVLISLFFTVNNNKVMAGNKDRAGQAGASELLINPWARSTGWGSSNSACVRGLESMYSNIAGTAFTNGTEVIFAHSIWLQGSGISINSFGLTQKVGEAGVLGLGIVSFGFGDIDITTVDHPEGGIGTYSPSFMNIGISYAKIFSNSIYGGINIRVISESTPDITGQGVAFDAGIQYVTGEKENIKFGISLKNVGPRMSYTGDGLSFRTAVNSSTMTVEQRSADFELPSLVNIGGAYDYLINKNHRVTFAGNFTSNSFTNDQYSGGIEYAFMNRFMVRGGYTYESDITDDVTSLTTFKGLSAGFTVEVPFSKESKSTFGLDYSFISTRNFGGCHNIGVRINL
ncbi:MAG: PorV/PorQ family protein [Bacteroidota bacterium]|nr:PorV/PorQ family protein [Bacteroidota bacterium]